MPFLDADARQFLLEVRECSQQNLLAASELMLLAPGTRLGLYEILTAIGAGGMGEVYTVNDTFAHRRRAQVGGGADKIARHHSGAILVAWPA